MQVSARQRSVPARPITNGVINIVNPSGQVMADPNEPPMLSMYLGNMAIVLALNVLWQLIAFSCAYHGYKRNGDNLGWGFAWLIMGEWFGPATLGVAALQGFAKPSST